MSARTPRLIRAPEKPEPRAEELAAILAADPWVDARVRANCIRLLHKWQTEDAARRAQCEPQAVPVGDTLGWP